MILLFSCSIARLRHLEFAEAVVWRLYRKYGSAGWVRGVLVLWGGPAIHRVGRFELHLYLRYPQGRGDLCFGWTFPILEGLPEEIWVFFSVGKFASLFH